MGVKDLWKLVDGVQETVPFTALRDQRLAVDLAIWIVEASGVEEMKGRVTRPHLRYPHYFEMCSLEPLIVSLVCSKRTRNIQTNSKVICKAFVFSSELSI